MVVRAARLDTARNGPKGKQNYNGLLTRRAEMQGSNAFGGLPWFIDAMFRRML
jgi:hypothetical protein